MIAKSVRLEEALSGQAHVARRLPLRVFMSMVGGLLVISAHSLITAKSNSHLQCLVEP